MEKRGRKGGGSGWVYLFCVNLMSTVLKNNKYLYGILIFNESQTGWYRKVYRKPYILNYTYYKYMHMDTGR